MMKLEQLDNKKFAFSCINLLKRKGYLSQVEIQILTNVDECKRLFCCSKFPILSEVSFYGSVEESDCYDDKGRQRFYKDKIYSEGRAFIITNHWYGPNKSMADNRTPFMQWVFKNIE